MISANFIYLSVLLVILITIIWRWPAHKKKQAIFSLSLWMILIFAIISGYSFRYELLNNRIIATLIPGYSYTDSDHSVNFKKAMDGHFYINANIENTTIKFLIDTGASDTSFSLKDAIRLNIDVNRLEYTKKYNTANGTIEAAPITIHTMKIGPLIIKDIPAVVNKSQMKTSLLGMSALSGFHLEVSNDTLTIKN